MNKIFNNGMLKNLFLFALVVCVICFAGDAMADGENVISKAANKIASTFNGARRIMFLVGAFALLGMAFMAFTGKMKWMWVAYLAIGMAILGLAGSIISFITTSNDSIGANPQESGAVDVWN